MSRFQVIEAEGTTNLAVNPSFETNTTGWAASAGHSINRNSTQSFKGVWSMQWVDAGAGTDMVTLAITLPTGTTSYVIQGRVYVPTGWDGGNIQFTSSAFAGSSEVQDIIWTDGTDPLDTWVYFQTTLTVAADVVGNIIIENTASPGAAITAFFDAIQIEREDTVTTYCDGDQPGCEWLGTPHAGQSRRTAVSRSGGILRDLQDFYSFFVANIIGAGVMPVSNNLQNYALLPGALWQNQKEMTRQVSLVGMLDMCDLEDTGHPNRRALIDAFTKDYLGQASILRYTGASVEKELLCRYETGLNFTGYQDRGIEMVNMRLLSEAPNWLDIADTGETLVESDTATFRYSGARVNGAWDDLGPPAAPATGGTVHVVKIGPDRSVYYGGTFTNWDGIGAADNIVRWDPVTATWNALATGVNNSVMDIVFGADGTMYICGTFLNAGGDAAADYIAQWNGAAFSAVGDPNSGGAAITEVTALAVGDDGTLYCGGDFTDLEGDASANHVAVFGAVAWAAIGFGFDNTVLDLVVDGDLLYACGTFTASGVNARLFVSFWDGLTWNDMDGGVTAGTDVRALGIATDGTLYAGGTYTVIGGVTVANIASWDGLAWAALGEGVLKGTPLVNNILVAPDGIVYVSGDFTEAGSLIAPVSGIARWNGFTWFHVDAALGAPSVVFDIGFLDPVISTNYDLYLGLDATGAVRFSGNLAATNPGTAFAQPILEIARSGGISAVLTNIRNETTGKEILLDYAILDGETLAFDFTPGQQTITSSFSGNRIDALLPNSDFASWGLNPGLNNITVFVDEGGGATAIGILWYRAPYKSFDD